MHVRAVDTTRLYQQVAHQIEELIRGGVFEAETRLPPERVLIKQLGVSRSVLREALIVLELQGLVEIKVGAGTYVKKPAEKAAAETGGLNFDHVGPFELLAARRLVEGEAAKLAATTATAEDIAKIEAAYRQIEEDIEPYMMRHTADRSFHTAIAEATRNPALITIIAAFWSRYRQLIIEQASERARRPENREAAIADHRAIFLCIKNRDGNGARAAIQAHLDRVGWFFSPFDNEGPSSTED